MNIIITSEHRVGSRWLHYLLADLYDMNTSPEIDVQRLYDENTIKEIRDHFGHNRIVKFHHALPHEIFKRLQPINYKIIGVVRNPRDRAVSFAFHNRYHKSDYPFPQKKCTSDADAVRFTVMEDEAFIKNTKRQFKLMDIGYSTRNFLHENSDYIWTAYEWMKEDNLTEIAKIAKFIGGNISLLEIAKVVEKHRFKNKAKGRKSGNEVRKNLWRRKGIVGDHENWFGTEMLKATLESNNNYWEILKQEEQALVDS